MLKIKNLYSGYGDINVLNDVSINVKPGESIALIGANGAGKTSLMKTIMGYLPVSKGVINFNGESLVDRPAHYRVHDGLCIVPEGRLLFPSMTVEENLQITALDRADRKTLKKELDHVYSIFPKLYERRKQNAATLSGGEQQMVALGRGIMAKPELLLLDEPSLGLAPLIVELIFSKLEEIVESGVTIFIAEQNVVEALSLCNRAYVIEQGKITLEGSSDSILKNDHIKEAFLGL